MKTIIACIALILAPHTALAAQCGPDNDHSKCRMVWSAKYSICMIADEDACGTETPIDDKEIAAAEHQQLLVFQAALDEGRRALPQQVAEFHGRGMGVKQR